MKLSFSLFFLFPSIVSSLLLFHLGVVCLSLMLSLFSQSHLLLLPSYTHRIPLNLVLLHNSTQPLLAHPPKANPGHAKVILERSLPRLDTRTSSELLATTRELPAGGFHAKNASEPKKHELFLLSHSFCKGIYYMYGQKQKQAPGPFVRGQGALSIKKRRSRRSQA
ncbi:hypothetical protein V8C44DRAFT_329219 [Trichoderma aethiopicum]